MPRYQNEREIIQRVSELRRWHLPIRTEISARMALGMAYANGKQWATVNAMPSGNQSVDEWDEDWDPHSSEIRVVDNKIGPLVRRVAASTNATRIEAAVSTPKHLRTIKFSKQARVSQDVLNALEHDANFTLAARNASSLRWKTGSSIIILRLSKKKQKIDSNIARHPDGSPVEINDQWVRWDYGPLTDLIWDPSNLSCDLENHSVLVHEEVMTVRKFEQLFGPVKEYGLKPDELPKISDLAPYYIAASRIGGTSYFTQFARFSEERGVRVLTLIEADPRDPTRWPEHYTVIDTSAGNDAMSEISGKVINYDQPKSCFGHHGRPFFKLDGYRRDDSVWSWGIPHVLMGKQDMLNIYRSLQFQLLTSAAHGQWVVDKQTTDRDSFITSLSEGVGGVLMYDSKQMPSVNPPQWVGGQPPADQFITGASDLTISMRDDVHISAANLGIGKTHVPEGVQQALLQEAGVVIDNIIQADSDTYSDALKTTLGTVRLAMNQPNRMLARLRDHHGFTHSDLMALFEVDPASVKLMVQVRRASIVSRSDEERIAELNNAVLNKIMSGDDFRLAMADDLERPLMRRDELELEWIQTQLINVMDGAQWIGLPSINFAMFDHAVRTAMYGLDPNDPESLVKLNALEQAKMIQHKIWMELKAEQTAVDDGSGAGMGIVASNGQPSGVSLLPDNTGGAPESINPMSSPVGAAGGLRMGLPASTS